MHPIDNTTNNLYQLRNEIIDYITTDYEANQKELQKIDPKILFDWSTKIINKINQKCLIHYPKLSLISLIAGFIFNVYFCNFFNTLFFVYDAYLFYQNRKYFIKATQIYENSNVCEFSAPYEQKKRIENVIYLRLNPFHLIEQNPVVGFFKSLIKPLHGLIEVFE
jgi:hypothetical protein